MSIPPQVVYLQLRTIVSKHSSLNTYSILNHSELDLRHCRVLCSTVSPALTIAYNIHNE